MTCTIEIKFLAQPAINDEFRIAFSLNGQPVIFPGGQEKIRKYYNTGAAPYGVSIGATLADTIALTHTNLNTFNHYEGISYSISGNSILVTFVYEGTLSITEMAFTSARMQVRDISNPIYFEGGLNTSALRKAYNNDILIFSSGVSIDPTHATITGSGLNLQLYPDPTGSFFINLKPYIAALINARNFEDRLYPNLDAASPASYIYRSNNGTYLESDLTFAIHTAEGLHAQALYNLAWFAGVEQPGFANSFTRDELYVLTPFSAETANSYYLKYWQGYPLDFSLYCPGQTIKLKNTATLLSQTFEAEEEVSRIVLSDGRTDETIDNLLPLSTGRNLIRIMPQESEVVTDKFLEIDKVPFSKGIYLKWFNKYGGYSYWLFEDTYTIDRSTKHLGELDRDFNNVENSVSRTVGIGKTSQDSLKIITEMLEPQERDVVEGLLDSPKIYMFTGKPFSRAEAGSWVEVNLKTTSARLKNARQPLTSFSFDIELPERYTQTL